MKTQKGTCRYQRRKEQVREEAKEWQRIVSETSQRFKCLGRRYGLQREFRENGII